MLRYILLLFSCITLVRLSFVIPDTNSTQDIELAAFAFEIFENECDQCRTALIIHTKNDKTANEFLKIRQISYKMAILSLLLRSGTNTSISESHETNQAENVHGRPDLTIIFLDVQNDDVIEDIILDLELLPLWNIRGRFLIVATNIPDDELWLNYTFESLWLKEIFRVTLCFWKDNLQIYTYNPFITSVGYKVTNRSSLTTVFSKPMRDMNGYPLKTYNLDLVMKGRSKKVIKNGKITWIGPDGLMISTFVETINASLKVHCLSDDVNEETVMKSNPNESLTNYIRILTVLYDFDMLFNGGNTYTDNGLDKVYCFERNDLFILIPSATEIPRYLYIFLIIRSEVWAATIGSFIGISITMFLTQKVTMNKFNISGILLDNFRLLLNESPPNRKRKHLERFLLILWIVLCIVFSTLFQSLLMGALVSPKYYQNIDSLEEFYKTDMKLYTSEFIKFHVNMEVTEETQELLEHIETLSRTHSVYGENIDWIAELDYKNGFIVNKNQITELKLRDKFVAHGAYHIIKESPMPSVYSYFIRKDKHFYPEFLTVMGWIQNAGLVLYWQRRNYEMDIIPMHHNATIELRPNIGENQLLNIQHLKSTFILLILGHSCALVTFCFEIISKRKH